MSTINNTSSSPALDAVVTIHTPLRPSRRSRDPSDHFRSEESSPNTCYFRKNHPYRTSVNYSVSIRLCDHHNSPRSELPNTPRPTASPKTDSTVIIRGGNRHRSRSLEDVRRQNEQESLLLWHEIVECCRILKQPFEDAAFQAIDDSIYGKFDLLQKRESLPMTHVWLRPHNIRTGGNPQPWTVFNNPRPSDIIQGSLGDCWFLSALSVLAEHEPLLRKILITHEFCAAGAYQVRLCKDGKWETVMVDDLFPCDNRHEPIFSRAKKNQLWVPLIEKALAKLYGNYSALTGGYAIEGLALLTGQPCETLMLSNVTEKYQQELIWAQLISSREMQFLFSASCGGSKVTEAEYTAVGLQRNHAYSVLDVQLCDGHRLLKMRDPHGKTNWKGDWSLASNRWTYDLRLRFEPELLSGTFWISFEDLMKYFCTIDICRIRDSWDEIRLSCKPVSLNSNKSTCYILNIFEPTEMELSLIQKSRRGTTDSSDVNTSLGIMVFAVRNGSIEHIDELVAFEKTMTYDVVNVSSILKCGQYFITSFFVSPAQLVEEIPAHHNDECVLALYSSKQILVEEVRAPEFLPADILISMCLSPIIKETVCIASDESRKVKFYVLDEWPGVNVVVAENNNDRLSILVSGEFSDGIHHIHPSRELSRGIKVPPGHRQIIKIDCVDYEMKLKFEMVKDESHVNRNTSVPVRKKTNLEKLYVPRTIL